MKNRKDEKWLDENISRAVDFGEVKFDTERWKEKYILDESNAKQLKIKSHKSVWRFIMESKVTRYSAAAVVTLAFILVLSNPFGSSKYGGVVLANVAQKMENIKLFVCKEHTLNIDIEKGDVTLETNGIKYLSTYGVIDEQYTTDGNLAYKFYVSMEQMKIVGFFPKMKGYVEIPLSETLAPLINRLTPYGLVEHIMEVEHKNLGRSKIGNYKVEGFEAIDVGLWPIQDTFNILCPVEQITWKLWIDIKSSLPVQIDYEVILGVGQFSGWKRLKMECKAYGFEFYQEVPEDMFITDIPEEYKPINIIKEIIPMDMILKFFKRPEN